MIIHTCAECNKEFTGRKKKYCSTECSEEVRRRKNKERWRKANPGWNDGTNKVCEWCGKEFTVPARNAHRTRFCSEKCNSRSKGHMPLEEYKTILDKKKQETAERKERQRKEKRGSLLTKECAECGQSFDTMQPGQLTCSLKCGKVRTNRISSLRKDKRINDTNIVDRDISLKVLYKRDEGICYICGNKCDYNDYKKDGSNFTSGPTYPSVDHLIPLSRGGKHAWYNVRLAHHRCNSLKSDLMIDDVKRYIPDNAYVLARKVSPNKKEVKQYSKSMELIAAYESTAEASRQTGIRVKGIQNCARKAVKTYGGYIWEY